jgi:Flp pilus assembly pilin Flp
VSRRQLASSSGQTQAEYGLVVAGIAAVIIVAVLLVGGVLSGKFDTSSKPFTPDTSPFSPPTTPELVFPTSASQCAGDGWKDFPQFEMQSDCTDYVDTVS